jgi:predicted DNA-binding protein with PD1-like motif
MIGDIATFDGRPVVTHVVLGRSDGSTVGGHVFELNVNPTLEVFVTTNTCLCEKSGHTVGYEADRSNVIVFPRSNLRDGSRE